MIVANFTKRHAGLRYRLATATGSEPGTYGYDSNGNITGDGTHTCQYSQRDRLATVDSGTTGTYSYDGDGRRVKKVAGGITTLYFYDNDGRLLEEYIPATGAGKDYVWMPGTYEPLGRIDFGLTETDNGNVLRVTKASPNVHLDWSLDATSGPFVLKRSLSFTFSNPAYLGPAQSTKTFNDGVLGNTTNYAYEAFRRTLTDTLYFYHADHLGTPIAMTNTTGTLVWRVEHTPFGGIYALTVGVITNNLRFPGQYFDGETGLSQNWHRDYSSKLGRYYEPDPLWFRGKLLRNTFTYVSSNPLRTTDLMGLYELVNFPPGTTASAGASVRGAISALKKCCGCQMCKDAANQLLNATVIFKSDLGAGGAVWTGAQTPLFAPPGVSPPYFFVGPNALDSCGGQIMAEEALHLAGASDSNNEASQIAASCVPCR